MQNVKTESNSIQKLEWKQTDRRTEAIALSPVLIWSVKFNVDVFQIVR